MFMRQRILAAHKLLDEEKDELLEDLNSLWKLVFDDTLPTRPGALKAMKKANKNHEA